MATEEPSSSLYSNLRMTWRRMILKYGEDMANKLMSKSELIQKIAEKHAETVTRKDVKGVIESLAEIGYKELKKTGAFVGDLLRCPRFVDI
jgi:hypothetical protein